MILFITKMFNFIWRELMNHMQTRPQSSWVKYASVFLLTFSWIVYLIPYLATDFYSQFLEAYNLTDGQLGTVITFFGLTATPGYFAGGWIADKFNSKKLVVLSCISTAAVAIVIALIHSYTLLILLYLLMGFTSAGLH